MKVLNKGKFTDTKKEVTKKNVTSAPIGFKPFTKKGLAKSPTK